MKVGDIVTVTTLTPEGGRLVEREEVGRVVRLNGNQVRLEIDGRLVWKAKRNVRQTANALSVLQNFVRGAER